MTFSCEFSKEGILIYLFTLIRKDEILSSRFHLNKCLTGQLRKNFFDRIKYVSFIMKIPGRTSFIFSSRITNRITTFVPIDIVQILSHIELQRVKCYRYYTLC